MPNETLRRYLKEDHEKGYCTLIFRHMTKNPDENFCANNLSPEECEHVGEKVDMHPICGMDARWSRCGFKPKPYGTEED